MRVCPALAVIRVLSSNRRRASVVFTGRSCDRVSVGYLAGAVRDSGSGAVIIAIIRGDRDSPTGGLVGWRGVGSVFIE